MKLKPPITKYLPILFVIGLGTISLVRAGEYALLIFALIAGTALVILVRWAGREIESRDTEIASLREMLPDQAAIIGHATAKKEGTRFMDFAERHFSPGGVYQKYLMIPMISLLWIVNLTSKGYRTISFILLSGLLSFIFFGILAKEAKRKKMERARQKNLIVN